MARALAGKLQGYARCRAYIMIDDFTGNAPKHRDPQDLAEARVGAAGCDLLGQVKAYVELYKRTRSRIDLETARLAARAIVSKMEREGGATRDFQVEWNVWS